MDSQEQSSTAAPSSGLSWRDAWHLFRARVLRPALHPLYWLYEQRLMSQVNSGPVPEHIGLILDGNRRYAVGRGLAARLGHSYGAEKLRQVLEWCLELGVNHVTLYVFSTENFRRPSEEVDYLLDLFVQESAALLEEPRIKSERVRVRVIGQRQRLPERVTNAIEALEVSTKDHDGMLLTIALAYGGREEIADAVKAMLCEAQTHGRSIESLITEVNADALERHLYTTGMPDPDFIIRTSGEQRLSGFLLWQSAYSEFHFVEALWPAFRQIDFLRAVRDYQRRERRYGR